MNKAMMDRMLATPDVNQSRVLNRFAEEVVRQRPGYAGRNVSCPRLRRNGHRNHQSLDGRMIGTTEAFARVKIDGLSSF